MPIDMNASLGRGIDTGQQFHAGAFSGAILAEQRKHLARPQIERDILDGDGAAECLGDPGQANGRACGCLSLFIAMRIHSQPTSRSIKCFFNLLY